MKFTIFTSLLLVSRASAFVPSTSRSAFGVGTKLYNAKVDSSQAVQAALEASKKYGVTSKEAQALWDAVEEMDASDNSAAYTGGLTEEECLLTVEYNEECQQYYKKLNDLSTALEDNKFRIENVKSLVTELQNIKIAEYKPSAQPVDAAAMNAALAEARKATEEFGPTSTEAKLAWETVEEIASSNNSEAYKGTLEDECLIETIQACEAIEELSRAVNVLQSDSRYQG